MWILSGHGCLTAGGSDGTRVTGDDGGAQQAQG